MCTQCVLVYIADRATNSIMLLAGRDNRYFTTQLLL